MGKRRQKAPEAMATQFPPKVPQTGSVSLGKCFYFIARNIYVMETCVVFHFERHPLPLPTRKVVNIVLQIQE